MWVAAQFLLSIQWLQSCLTYKTNGICTLCLCNVSVIFSVSYHDFTLIWFLHYCIMAMSLSSFYSFYVIVFSWANHHLPWERMKESLRGLATWLHTHNTQSSRRESFLTCQGTRSIPLCVSVILQFQNRAMLLKFNMHDPLEILL